MACTGTMEGMSERQYAAHVGLSRGAIQKAKEAERLVQHADGSIDTAASDVHRAAMTNPAKQRGASANAPPPAAKLKPVPDTALSTVGDTLREQGLAEPLIRSCPWGRRRLTKLWNGPQRPSACAIQPPPLPAINGVGGRGSFIPQEPSSA